MSSSAPSLLQINGSVAPGFESVRDCFKHQMRTLAERNAQLCVYHKGEKVVDLWGTAIGDDAFSPDSLVTVFSSGKSLEAIAVAFLVDQGLLEYSAPVTDYWPEFGANGKDGITVADVMRHEAGLANLETTVDMEDLFTDKLKQNTVGRILEQHAPDYSGAEGGKREYHALTRGWIVNELFRRVEPQGRTIGEFMRDEVCGPLDADVKIGITEEELPRISKGKVLGFGYQFFQSLIPRFMGRRIVHNIFQIVSRLIRLVPSMMRSRKKGYPPPLDGRSDMNVFQEPNFARGETPSAGASCSARGLAKLGAIMSGGGNLQGRQYLSDKAWQALHANQKEAQLGSLMVTRFTQGGVDYFKPPTQSSTQLERDFNEGREGFYGWMGFGGSIFQWHPEHDISFAFVPTSLHFLDMVNERGKNFQSEVLRCVQRLG